MKINLGDLNSALSQQLQPIYIVSGDEPLQLNEACDAIRAAAKKQNRSEIKIFIISNPSPRRAYRTLLPDAPTVFYFIQIGPR